MIRKELVDAVAPSPETVLDVIIRAEAHKKFVWTAWRVLKEAALSTRLEELDYEERKLVVKHVNELLKDLASRRVLYRRTVLQSIGWGNEIGYDFVFWDEKSDK
jgi:galactose-1-phosphate uridylyltransferase